MINVYLRYFYQNFVNDLNQEIDEKLNKLLLKIFEIEQIDHNSSMDDIPEWDSFRHIQLLTKIENEFKIKIEMSDFTIMTSIPIIKSKISMYLNER